MLRIAAIILIIINSCNLSAQNPNKPLWSDTTYVSVNLLDSLYGKKLVVVDIGDKATIYMRFKDFRKLCIKNRNEFNKEDINTMITTLDSNSKNQDTVYIDSSLPMAHIIISKQLQKGAAKVYYKKQKRFVDSISHRLERYGKYAYRFFYLTDQRPFFASIEYSGIIDDDNLFNGSDLNELEKLGKKLSSLREK
jgi:hypothetical protein